MTDDEWTKQWQEYSRQQLKKQGKIISSVWAVGFHDRGLGHGDFGVIIEGTEELVVKCDTKEIAAHIVEVHNAASTTQAPRRRNKSVAHRKSHQ